MSRPDYAAILRTLVERGVDFIGVGGVGAVLQGAPITTFDLDVLHSTEQANVERLMTALDSLDAGTRHGPLDLLGSIGKGHQYGDLIPHTEPMEIASDIRVPVLELSKLIAVKEETAGEKDCAVLPILRRTLQERHKS